MKKPVEKIDAGAGEKRAGPPSGASIVAGIDHDAAAVAGSDQRAGAVFNVKDFQDHRSLRLSAGPTLRCPAMYEREELFARTGCADLLSTIRDSHRFWESKRRYPRFSLIRRGKRAEEGSKQAYKRRTPHA